MHRKHGFGIKEFGLKKKAKKPFKSG